ncbi:uncharacterized protein LOC116853414 [Odontomachus brunneus]|uniref:uncharacterized protein LOC116853414 n=1 Tax=Odontomachus brunneus TaxID=486640 RepID=UPI0013F227B9|nr:uncharacterized protein LOC116853414 [Odontomachus brunneus]
MSKKYHIVEFDDGLQIIPDNWFTSGEKTALYWPNVSNENEYNKAVEKMKDFNRNNVTIVPVKRIFGSTNTFGNAKNKLKLTEKLSDVNSDEDNNVAKRKRRLYAQKVISSSSEEEPTQPPKNEKIDKYPDVPQNMKHSKSYNATLNDINNRSEKFNNKIQDIYDDNYESISNIQQISDTRILAERNCNTVQNRYQKQIISHSLRNENKNTNSQNAEQLINQPIPRENTSNFLHTISSTREFDEFRQQVYKNFSVMKQKLDIIIQNQVDSFEQQRNMYRQSNEPAEETENIMSQFPIETDESLNQLEVALMDNKYCKTMEAALSTVAKI